ncbi:hypothetical protein [Actinoplanes sp. NPDC051494]|uniref:hypothetical protein n=1 Tax=Actinoplanes sp. NPDC051494 TaxID=3363907 RepID=UPI0037A977C5
MVVPLGCPVGGHEYPRPGRGSPRGGHAAHPVDEVGGLTITAGLGYTAPLWAGAGITAAGLVVMVIAYAAARTRVPTPVPSS